MLHENKKRERTFASLRDLMNSNQIPEDVEIMIRTHERTKTGHDRKYNVPEESEVAALIVGEQYDTLDFVQRRRGRIVANGFEKLDVIRQGDRKYDSLCYSLLWPHGNGGWHFKLTHLDSKGKHQKLTSIKFCSRLLFQRECDFNILIYFGRLFQQYLCKR